MSVQYKNNKPKAKMSTQSKAKKQHQPPKTVEKIVYRDRVVQAPAPPQQAESSNPFKSIGSSIGGFLGNGLSKILGMGKYTIKNNTLYRGSKNFGQMSAQAPTFGTGSSGTIRMQHTEVVCDVVSSTSFNSFILINNPGSSISFPLLSGIARNFELYRFLGLGYMYVPLSSTSSTNAALGSVCIATEYDCTGPPMTNKREMLATEYSDDLVPFESILHGVECSAELTANRMNVVLPGITEVADGNLVNGYTTDPHTYIPSYTQVATVNNPVGGQVLGEIRVTYDILLSRPVFLPSTADPTFAQHFSGTATTNAAVVTVLQNLYTGNKPFTLSYVGSSTSTNITITNPNGNVGNFLVVYQMGAVGSTVQSSSVSPAVTGGCTFTLLARDSTSGDHATVGGRTAGTTGDVSNASSLYGGSSMTCMFTMADNTGTFQCGVGTSVNTQYWDIYIVDWPQNLNFKNLLKTTNGRLEQLEELVKRMELVQRSKDEVRECCDEFDYNGETVVNEEYARKHFCHSTDTPAPSRSQSNKK